MRFATGFVFLFASALLGCGGSSSDPTGAAGGGTGGSDTSGPNGERESCATPLALFEGASCSGTPPICTKDKLPIGADHVAGAYVPITDGQPITVVVTANESSAPSGAWTISMGA